MSNLHIQTIDAENPSAREFDRAFHSTKRVEGYTHDFYKYPARFSPDFVRFVLDSLTEPGDWVLDPFMGGGTTVVEAAASGRHAIGSDLNELAYFVTGVKTTPLSRHDITDIRRWVYEVRHQAPFADHGGLADGIPVKNMPLRLYRFFASALTLLSRLKLPRRRRFAQCALLRLGQWALESRLTFPSNEEMGRELEDRVERMIRGMSEFVAAARTEGIYKNKITARRRIMSLSVADKSLARTLHRREVVPRLILTSPPYPGVHILYHRWQVQGRRETPAPYWIAGARDGCGEAYYTMGGRSEIGVTRYFESIAAAFGNLRLVASPDTIVVQLISLADSEKQLSIYLEAMESAGFEETSVAGLRSQQVRAVPNRKWYTQRRPPNDASREILLVHRPVSRSHR